MNLKQICWNIVFGLRGAQKEIEKWELPPDIKKLFDELWVNLPKEIQEVVWNLVRKICDKYGEDAAVVLLNNILKGLKNQIWVVKK